MLLYSIYYSLIFIFFFFFYYYIFIFFFFFSSRRRHTRFDCDWSSRRVLFRSSVSGGVVQGSWSCIPRTSQPEGHAAFLSGALGRSVAGALRTGRADRLRLHRRESPLRLRSGRFLFIDKILNVGGHVAFDDLWMRSVRSVVSFVLKNTSYKLVRASSAHSLAVGRRLLILGHRIRQNPLGRDWTLKFVPQNVAVLKKLGEERLKWGQHRAF